MDGDKDVGVVVVDVDEEKVQSVDDGKTANLVTVVEDSDAANDVGNIEVVYPESDDEMEAEDTVKRIKSTDGLNTVGMTQMEDDDDDSDSDEFVDADSYKEPDDDIDS